MKWTSLLLVLLALNSHGATWERNETLPKQGRDNPYNVPESDIIEVKRKGLIHALMYPVDVTGSLLPTEAIKRAFDQPSDHPFKQWARKMAKSMSGIKSFDGLQEWLGLQHYPQNEGEGAFYVPFKNNIRPDFRMGHSPIMYKNTPSFTYACATCHASNLFGKKFIGLTNRFPRANRLFVKAKEAFKILTPTQFKYFTDATAGEVEVYKRTRKNLRSVESTKPIQLGLDTSLAHVALSLTHRRKDAYATKDRRKALIPDRDPLRTTPADSKPGVWWNLKYKNRFLLDGSVVSGNPIWTNILWNEIGRGVDLRKLETWLDENEEVIKELTTAVFSIEPPRITDFFSENYIDLAKAKRGEKLFNRSCKKCHGVYKKNWSQFSDDEMAFVDLIKTSEVNYPQPTPVKNVGTDPYRHRGMKSLLRLNDLQLSKNKNIVIEMQEGYVPPPLVGIWARWPYFHNNSIPNLCALMTPPKDRPLTFYTGEALDPDRDFDFECNGYPLGDDTPEGWKTREYLVDTRRRGLSNSGHYRMFLRKDGSEKFTADDKSDLLMFLQTL